MYQTGSLKKETPPTMLLKELTAFIKEDDWCGKKKSLNINHKKERATLKTESGQKLTIGNKNAGTGGRNGNHGV